MSPCCNAGRRPRGARHACVRKRESTLNQPYPYRAPAAPAEAVVHAGPPEEGRAVVRQVSRRRAREPQREVHPGDRRGGPQLRQRGQRRRALVEQQRCRAQHARLLARRPQAGVCAARARRLAGAGMRAAAPVRRVSPPRAGRCLICTLEAHRAAAALPRATASAPRLPPGPRARRRRLRRPGRRPARARRRPARAAPAAPRRA